MQEKPDFKTSFLALMEEESAGGHPSGETLAAFSSGGLAPEQRAGVGSHLAGCRECAELARDLELFTDSPSSAEAANEFEVAAFLRTLKPQLAPESSAKATSWHRPLAMAASLALAVGVSWSLSRDLTRRQVLAELSRPRANVPIVDLIEDASQRTGRPAALLEIRRDVGGMLILTPASPGDFPVYQAKILDSDDTLVDTIEDLEMDPEGDAFTLLIAAGSLEPGDYRVELYGLGAEHVEAIAGYRVRVVDPPEATS